MEPAATNPTDERIIWQADVANPKVTDISRLIKEISKPGEHVLALEPKTVAILLTGLGGKVKPDKIDIQTTVKQDEIHFDGNFVYQEDALSTSSKINLTFDLRPDRKGGLNKLVVDGSIYPADFAPNSAQELMKEIRTNPEGVMTDSLLFLASESDTDLEGAPEFSLVDGELSVKFKVGLKRPLGEDVVEDVKSVPAENALVETIVEETKGKTFSQIDLNKQQFEDLAVENVQAIFDRHHQGASVDAVALSVNADGRLDIGITINEVGSNGMYSIGGHFNEYGFFVKDEVSKLNMQTEIPNTLTDLFGIPSISQMLKQSLLKMDPSIKRVEVNPEMLEKFQDPTFKLVIERK